jgi:hypothetical protein
LFDTSVRIAALPLAVLIGALAGCASSVPKATIAQPIAVNARIAAPDQETVRVDATDSVKILPSEIQRLTEKVTASINTRKLANSSDGADGRSYEVDLSLTRYEKGNAFARAMLAGLGQIHIDGKVTLFLLPDHTKVGEFQLAKTFAWGGIFGAATSMDDIENTFADGVAATVTGQSDEKKKDKPATK